MISMTVSIRRWSERREWDSWLCVSPDMQSEIGAAAKAATEKAVTKLRLKSF